MPLARYGVLKGKAIEVRLGGGSSPHYQVRLVDDTTDYRIAVNVKSSMAPSELEYLTADRYQHPLTAVMAALPRGFTAIAPGPAGGALDYIRGNLFDRTLMRPLPFNVPGPDNDLNDKIDRVMQRAMADEDSLVYAFGQRWGPETIKDKYFGFLPGNGIHDIHMNQGNDARFRDDDGVWQDGGLLVHFPAVDEWVGIFLKFQSQTWHTDDANGHRIGEEPGTGTGAGTGTGSGDTGTGGTGPGLPTTGDPQGLVRIVAALVNGVESPEVEVVTLLNAAPHEVSLEGWGLLDKEERRQALGGTLAAGEARAIRVQAPVALSNKGGVITLVSDDGLKVDGVAYTRDQARNPGWTLVF